MSVSDSQYVLSQIFIYPSKKNYIVIFISNDKGAFVKDLTYISSFNSHKTSVKEVCLTLLNRHENGSERLSGHGRARFSSRPYSLFPLQPTSCQLRDIYTTKFNNFYSHYDLQINEDFVNASLFRHNAEMKI